MSHNTFVSVIIPTFKNRGLLSDSIESVLSQDYPFFEILVIDDNEPDSEYRMTTEELMKKYDGIDNVRYIKHECNKNGAAARNTGILHSQGDYIAFLDDDDCFLPGKLSKQVQFLNENQEYAAVYCLAKIDGKDEPTTPFEGNVIIPLFMNRAKMFTPSLMFKKEALLTIQGFNESFRRHQDYELLVKFFEAGFKMGCIKERLVEIHSIGGNRLTAEKKEEIKAKFLLTFNDTLDKLEAQTPGIKNKIIANNYASLFISHLSGKKFKRAFNLIKLYFWKSPIGFISYLFYFTRRYIKVKIGL